MSALDRGVLEDSPKSGPWLSQHLWGGSGAGDMADVALCGSQQVSLNECCKLITSPAIASIITVVVIFAAHFLMSYRSPGHDLPAVTSQAVTFWEQSGCRSVTRWRHPLLWCLVKHWCVFLVPKWIWCLFSSSSGPTLAKGFLLPKKLKKKIMSVF